MIKAADLYFNAEASYRAVGRQLHVRPSQVFQWIHELGKKCKSFTQVAQELSLHYSGYLLADGTTVHVKGKKRYLLLTADAHTHDIPYAHLPAPVCLPARSAQAGVHRTGRRANGAGMAHRQAQAGLGKSEDYDTRKAVFIGIRDRIQFPLKAIVIDGDRGLLKAVKEVFPTLPIQLCVRRLHNYNIYHLKYQFTGPSHGIEPFLDITHKLLYAKNPEHLQILIEKYNSMRTFLIESGLEAEVVNFETKSPYMWTHFRYPELPRTTNIIEAIIDQLKHKITDCHGFEYHETAWNTIKMIIMNYRFHRFTCSRQILTSISYVLSISSFLT